MIIVSSMITVRGMFNRFKQNIFKQVTFTILDDLRNNILCVQRGLQSRGGLEQVLVVIVHVVQVVLHDGPLGNLPQHLIHHWMRDVVPQQVQHETIGSTKLKIFQPPSSHLPHENGPEKTES